MKKLVIILVMVFASCNTGHIQVSKLSDGAFVALRDSNALTIVGDTILVRTSIKFGSDYLYGKYVGVVPNGGEYFVYSKAIRVK